MSFDLDEDQRELRGLAAGLFAREAAGDRLEAHERSGEPFDRALWASLARSGLLGVSLPEEVGGAGLGAVELAVVLREIGAHVAPIPAFAALALGAMPIARHGTPGQRELLEPLVAGDTVLTGAVREPGASGTATTARRDGDSHVLDGVKTFVPYAEVASHILVPARTGTAVEVFLVEPGAVALSPHPSATGEPMSRIRLDGVRVGADALLGGPDADPGSAYRTLCRFARAGATATVSGVIEGALGLTTEYVKTREQFERKLAQFQAVTMQIGDVYIAKRSLDVAMWAGVWRLDESPDEADEVLTVASYNACDPVLKALYTCQHLHGGIGLDVTYPLHRFFAWGKHYAHLLGGAEAQLDSLGALIATREGLGTKGPANDRLEEDREGRGGGWTEERGSEERTTERRGKPSPQERTEPPSGARQGDTCSLT
ncbi:acyl-CoA/acyl-ACP dehydrogenase [Actinomadura alba]|uniref:Acyl-CoA/acyl-ACP dehydrogenase n=2 Tax=Actinomadura alba TaxID=406431 RepID=A0ABR7M103_9ACTN|nr:acyl-CoA/acyl-ACP dehydrogenase [Actinomadura alba]